MTISITGTEVCLEGDWTLSGVTCNLDSLSQSLQQFEHGKDKKLRIDCARIKEADVSGLQLLNVCMQCIRFRGVEPILINIPDRLRHAMHVLVGHCVVDGYPETAMKAGQSPC